MPVTKEQFLQRWIAELGNSNVPNWTAWDATAAIKELSKDPIRFYLVKDPLCADDLVREADVYECHRQHVSDLNQMFDDVEDLLKTIKRRVAKQESGLYKRIAVPTAEGVSHLLSDLLTYIADKQKALLEMKATAWEDALKTYPLRTEDYDHVRFGLGDPEPYFKQYADPHLQRLIDRSQSLPHLSRLLRAIDLDRRFQIRVAAILAREFRHLSKMTIARLVVLTYICADLVDTMNGAIRIRGHNRDLTHSAVYERIRQLDIFAAQESKKP